VEEVDTVTEYIFVLFLKTKALPGIALSQSLLQHLNDTLLHR
jgi:hypothetical protein